MHINSKGVSYIRVSTDKQGESRLGLEAQQKAVYNYSDANSLEVIKEFVEVESGKKSKRHVLQKALAYWRVRLLLSQLIILMQIH